jgi:hypothetical protein
MPLQQRSATFRAITMTAGIGADRTPRELRHSFVSVLGDNVLAGFWRAWQVAKRCWSSTALIMSRALPQPRMLLAQHRLTAAAVEEARERLAESTPGLRLSGGQGRPGHRSRRETFASPRREPESRIPAGL